MYFLAALHGEDDNTTGAEKRKQLVRRRARIPGKRLITNIINDCHYLIFNNLQLTSNLKFTSWERLLGEKGSVVACL